MRGCMFCKVGRRGERNVLLLTISRLTAEEFFAHVSGVCPPSHATLFVNWWAPSLTLNNVRWIESLGERSLGFGFGLGLGLGLGLRV
jgi:hypothetical protein